METKLSKFIIKLEFEITTINAECEDYVEFYQNMIGYDAEECDLEVAPMKLKWVNASCQKQQS